MLIGICLGLNAGEEAQADPSPALPPRPSLAEPQLAPQAAHIIKQAALSYDPGMTPQDRDRDYLMKVAQAKNLLSLTQLVDLRMQSLRLLDGRGETSWETLRNLKWPQGDRVGVVLRVPVWVPSRAQRLPAYAGFEKQWQTVALTLPRPSGYVWFAGSLADINNKAGYRAESTQVEVNSRFAPLAALFLEYIFREGWYEVNKRVPLLVVRIGEDTWAVSALRGPVTAECLSFPDQESASLEGVVVQGRYESMAEIHHGRHVPISNHRLGLALDLNDFNFKGVVDGNPNPVSLSLRQYNRDAMHRLDARNLPAWVYSAAKWLGLRIPQEWLYTGFSADWPHFDVGTRNKSRDPGH
ncbi:MAG: hypothetical protein ACUVXF_04020 [Desulfobaccales bacterium]